MARCKCDPDTCGCQVRAGTGIVVAGRGDATSPFVISAIPNCVLCDEPGVAGDVLTRNDLGQYVPMPPPGANLCIDCSLPANPDDRLGFNATTGFYEPMPPIQGPQGEAGSPGPVGPQGPPGQSVQIKGAVPTAADLLGITDPIEGDGYITQDDGHLHTFVGPPPNDDPSDWADVGNITGPAGPQGTRGSLWYTGSVPPTTITGQLPNDLYLDVVTGDVYQFAA